MRPLIIGGLISWAVNLGIGLFVYFNNPKREINRTFAFFNICIGSWSLGSFLLNTIPDKNIAIWILRLSYLFAILLIPTFLHLVYVLIEKKISRAIIWISRLFSAFLIFALPTPWFIKAVYVLPKDGLLISSPGPIYIVFVIGFIVTALFGFSKLILAIKASSEAKRNQLKYISTAYIIATIAGFDYFLSVFRIFKGFPIDDYILVFSFSILAYAIIKHRLMEIKIAATRAIIFFIVYGLLLISPVITFFASRHLLLQILSGSNWWILPLSIFTYALLASLAPVMNNYLRRKAESRLLAEDLKKYDILKRLTRTIGLIRDLDKIVSLIAYRMVKTLRVSHAMVFLFDRGENSYVLKSMRRLNGIKLGFSSNIPQDTDFIKFLLLWRKDLLLEDVQKLIQEPKPNNSKHGKGYEEINLPKVASLMQTINASLIIPHFLEKELIGFLVLGKKDSNRPYSEADIEVLSTLSRSASLQIMNAMSMNELQKTERELAEATRLAHIGYVSSSIGHQIRNLLASINSIGMALLASPAIAECLTDKPEAMAQFEKHINDIFEFVQDGSMIINELTEYSRPDADKEYVLVNLKDVLDKTLKVLYVQANKFQTIDIVINIAPDAPKVLGSFVSLQNVFINMLNNAYDIIQETKHHIADHPELGITSYKGKIEIVITREKGNVNIHIIDNGKGIPPDVQKRLFTPLYTTKGSADKRQQQKLSGGTGIGLYTILVIIKNHGGTIKLYETEPMKGTDFLIELPVPREKGEA
jgi:signal transduction histidine kinase